MLAILEKIIQQKMATKQAMRADYAAFVRRIATGSALDAGAVDRLQHCMFGLAITDERLAADVGVVQSAAQLEIEIKQCRPEAELRAAYEAAGKHVGYEAIQKRRDAFTRNEEKLSAEYSFASEALNAPRELRGKLSNLQSEHPALFGLPESDAQLDVMTTTGALRGVGNVETPVVFPMGRGPGEDILGTPKG